MLENKALLKQFYAGGFAGNTWQERLANALEQQQVLVLLEQQLSLSMYQPNIELEADFVFIDWQLAGESYQVEFDVESQQATIFHTNYGWLAKLNDLHKGRHTNALWNAIIDISGVLVVLFSVTGFILLMPNKKKFKPSMIIGVVSGIGLMVSAVMY